MILKLAVALLRPFRGVVIVIMSVADVTVALQQSVAYQVVAETNRPEWLAYCAKLPAEDTTMPGDDLEWSRLNGLEPVKAREVALEHRADHCLTQEEPQYPDCSRE